MVLPRRTDGALLRPVIYGLINVNKMAAGTNDREETSEGVTVVPSIPTEMRGLPLEQKEGWWAPRLGQGGWG